MRIKDIYKQGLGISIEIFPPKTEKGDATLFSSLDRLSRYKPAFISCTYGAGGSTRGRTLEWCENIQSRYALTSTAHFTCIGSSRSELMEWLAVAKNKGIQNVLALRGDIPEGEANTGELSYANELVSLIKENFPEFSIGVAGYPEKHPQAPDAEDDLKRLKDKVDAGADGVYTQLFFENKNFFNFKERYEKAGINVPLIPGIMPITEFARIKRITSMCGAYFPPDLSSRLEKVQDDKEAQLNIGVEHAITQCEQLIKEGVAGIHFYVLNQSGACEKILSGLGIQPS